MMKIGVMASGRGSNLQAIIDAVKAGTLPVEIACVISDSKDALALERARKSGIRDVYLDVKSFPTRKDFYAKVVETFKNRGVECVVLAGFMRIVKEPLLSAYKDRIVNIHPALLPSFPGLHGQKQAVDYGAKVSGCTVHLVDAGCDTGPIIAQVAVPVKDDDTEETLSERILKEEHKLFPKVIGLIAAGKIRIEGRKVLIQE
jgi:phosphoribosylglycinamide formyltransferase-1